MEKKLYKSSNNKVFAGVCGGIGEYFSIDPVLVRLLWVAFILMAGTGLIAYIIAAIIIPKNPEYVPIDGTYVRTDEGIANENLTEEEIKERQQAEARKNTRSALFTLGIVLIVFGIIIFLRSHLPWIPEETFLAVLLIGIGGYFIYTKK